MRLPYRFLIALSVLVIMGLMVYGYSSVRRHDDLFQENLLRDNQTLGRVLAGVMADIWQREGPERSLRLLDVLEEHVPQVRVRWIPYEGLDGDEPLSKPLTRLDDVSATPRFLRTYVPIRTSRGHVGAIEVARSLTERDAFVAATLRNMLILSMLTLVLCVLVFWHPEKARRMDSAANRLPPLGPQEPAHATDEGSERTTQTDRLGLLATEVSSLGLRLAETRSALISEENGRRGAEDQLRHAERLSTVGRLAAGIAHELGTPLNVIIGRASMIAQGDFDQERARRGIEIIHEQALRITQTIKLLLDFARVNATARRRVDLVQLATSTASLLRDSWGSSHAELVVEESAERAETLADHRQLQQVLTNLVVNAFQALDEAGTVIISTTRERRRRPLRPDGSPEEVVCLRVRDDGCGIAGDLLPHIFEPFVTTKAVGKGTGLGLSVAYGIVEDHGGWIEVDSRPGEGSCFTVCLQPCAPDDSD